ncbi:MAG TPA: prolipoprotein diacylglyceryl transferase family protein [Polyangiaceae bacterium]|nr:prolipoprotein diacylglyceryl transferase family protein [Polyangiaceae bacterium]
MHGWLYPLLSCVGLLISAALGQKLLRAAEGAPEATRPSMPASVHPHLVFAGALFGALIGAKLGYFFAEWLPQRLSQSPLASFEALLFGRTVLGALLGGYAGVELVKRLIHYRRATGDGFAVMAPLSIGLGRIGCWGEGCCLGVEHARSWFTLDDAQGIARWPAVPVELAFNVLFGAAVAYYVLRMKPLPFLKGQLFHVYLVSYGAFRLWHETLRETPHAHGMSGYQGLAVLVVLLGGVRFVQRQRGKTKWEDEGAAGDGEEPVEQDPPEHDAQQGQREVRAEAPREEDP